MSNETYRNAYKEPSNMSFSGYDFLALAVVGAMGYGAYAGITWADHHIIGSSGPQVPKKEAQHQSLDRYNHMFKVATPAGKFIIQYLHKTNLFVDQYPTAHGIFNADVQTWDTVINNGCLFNTAYDIEGGRLNVTAEGLFSYVNASGNNPAAAAFAEIDRKNPNDLIVESGHTNSVSLLFSGLESGHELLPANEQTINILTTYGCKVGVQSTSTGY